MGGEGGGVRGGAKPPPLVYFDILLYNFSVTYSNFINCLDDCFKIPTAFCSVSTSSRPGIIFCVSFVRVLDISLSILVIFESRWFKKNFYSIF